MWGLRRIVRHSISFSGRHGMKVSFWRRAAVLGCLLAFALMVAPNKGTRPGVPSKGIWPSAPKAQTVDQSVANPLPDLVWTGTVKSISVLDGDKLAEVGMESDSGPITL